MSDERYTFEQARIRLEEIATLVRKKDTSLEKSLDLLEEGVRLANICTDLVDHTDLSATAVIEKVEEPAQDADTHVDPSRESESENLADESEAADGLDVSEAADEDDAGVSVDDSDESAAAEEDDPDDDSGEE